MPGLPSTLKTQFKHSSLALVVLTLIFTSGCNFVPRSRLEDGHRVAQTLRADNDRLKDQALDLRTKNQDLVQRAQDDAKRLAIQEEAVQRLEKSVTAYQKERDQLAAAFESLKRQVRLSLDGKTTESADNHETTPPPADAADPFDAFANEHPEWTFDRDKQTFAIAADRLFAAGSNTLKPDTEAEIAAFGEAVAIASKTSGDPIAVEIEAPGELAEVHQAVFNADSDPTSVAARRFSGASRAASVRDSILKPSALDPSQVRIAPPEEGHEGDPPAGNPQVVLRLVPDPQARAKAVAGP